MKIISQDKKIKIGIFVDGDFIPSFDGASNRFQYLSRYLQRNGVEVIIFHGYRGWSDLNLIKKEPFKTYIFPIRNYYKNLNLIASLIKKENIRFLQFDNLEPIILQGIKLAHLTNSYLISEMHYVVRNLAHSLGATPSRIRIIKKIEEIVDKAVDHLICLSKDDKPKLIKNMKLSLNRVSVIPSGVDVKNIKFFGPNFTKRTILFLGNLFFEPNAQALEIIYKNIYTKLKNCEFLIVGDCPDNLRKKYKNTRFKFMGALHDLNKIFKQSTVALAPILEDTGLRIKILNYLAGGMPVIATSMAANGFTKHNKKNIVIEDDFKKYPNIIENLFNKHEKSSRLARNGRLMIEKEYNWDVIARKTIKTYQKILKLKPKDKNNSLREALRFNFKEPVWLEEAKKKGRFSKCRMIINKNFTYGIINGGNIKIIK